MGGADNWAEVEGWGGSGGHKVSAPEGPSGQALALGTGPQGSWGTLWTQSWATLPSPLWTGRGGFWAGPSSYPVLPHPVLDQSERLRRLLEDEASIGERLHDVGDVLAVINAAVGPTYVLQAEALVHV